MNNYFWFIILLFFSACSLKKPAIIKPINSVVSTEYLIDSAQANLNSLECVSAKIKGVINTKEQRLTFNANLVIKTDSLIWISVSAMLGIEAFKVLITADSVKILNRLNKTYFVGDIQSLANNYNLSVSFRELQNLLFARVSLSEELTFSSRQEGKNYRIESVGENVNIRFLLNEKLLPLVYELKSEKMLLKAAYSKYFSLDKMILPGEANFLASSPSNEIELKCFYSNISTNTPKKVHFAIPKSYAPIF